MTTQKVERGRDGQKASIALINIPISPEAWNATQMVSTLLTLMMKIEIEP
jgi:hypothetical protein